MDKGDAIFKVLAQLGRDLQRQPGFTYARCASQRQQVDLAVLQDGEDIRNILFASDQWSRKGGYVSCMIVRKELLAECAGVRVIGTA